MRSPPQKTQTLRGCVATTVSRRAMTVGSIMGKSGQLLPEDRLFLGDELVVLPKSHAPGGPGAAGPKFFPADFEELRHVPIRRVGLREHCGGFPHLPIFEFHQADAGGRPADVELLALRLAGQVSRRVTETRGFVVSEKGFLLGGTDVLQPRAAADFDHARSRGRAGDGEEERKGEDENGERKEGRQIRGAAINGRDARSTGQRRTRRSASLHLGICGMVIHSRKPSTMTVISPLTERFSSFFRMAARSPRRISSNFLVNSRATTARRLPSWSCMSWRLFTSR